MKNKNEENCGNDGFCIEDVVAKLSDNSFGDVASGIIVNRLKVFVDHVCSWGKIHNIISRNYTEKEVWLNVCDSIFTYPILKYEFTRSSERGYPIVDAGSGGGFPGIPLSIIFQQNNFLLVDSNRKKCSFLRAIKSKIGLTNVTVINKNLQELEPAHFIITKAAFSPPHAGVLGDALEKSGKLAIWASINNSDQFVDVLKRSEVFLSSKHEYSLPGGKKRQLLIFIKPDSAKPR